MSPIYEYAKPRQKTICFLSFFDHRPLPFSFNFISFLGKKAPFSVQKEMLYILKKIESDEHQ